MDLRTAIVVVDYQNDFADPGGTLFVSGGDRILPAVNTLVMQTRARGGLVVLTQDWHPPDHVSFAATHGVDPFTDHAGGIAWPVHCVAGTWGAEFPAGLSVEAGDRIVRKGCLRDHDSFSGFGGREVAAGATLDELLRKAGIATLDVAGLATDICVRATVLDALGLGFRVRVHTSASRPVEAAAGERALAEMAAAGALVV
ncbi:MAG: isochorismatase family protein [Planctomycetaceae bacterium]